MKKHLSFAIILLTFILTAVLLVACSTPVEEEKPVPVGKQDILVSDAVTEAFEGLKKASSAKADSQFLGISLSGRYVDDDFVNHNFSFDGKFDISSANVENGDNNSSFALALKEESTDVFNLYLKEGILYLKTPPVIANGKFESFNFAQAVKSLHNSYNTTDGVFNNVASLLPTLCKEIFVEAYKEIKGADTVYTFVLDYAKVASALPTLLSQMDLGLTYTDILAVLGFTESEFANMAGASGERDTALIVNLTEGVFKSAYYVKDVDSALNDAYAGKESFKLDTLVIKGEPVTVSLPDNLGNYQKFDLANLSLKGTLTLSANGGTQSGSLFTNSTLSANLTKEERELDFELLSNRKNNGDLEFSLSLSTLGERKIAIFSNGDKVYFDFSAYGVAPLWVKAEDLSDKITTLGFLKDSASLDYKEILAIFAQLLGNRKESGPAVTTYTLEKDAVESILKVIGYDSVLDYDSLSATITTRNKEFSHLNLNFSAYGMNIELDADQPTVGVEVKVTEPDWTSSAINFEEKSFVTPTVKGIIREGTEAGDSVELLNALLYSLTGREFSLGEGFKGDLEYTVSANITKEGAITSFKADFEVADHYIGSFYFKNDNKIYVVTTPDSEGYSYVEEYNLRSEGNRYGGLLNAINGNNSVDYTSPLWSISNSGGLSLSVNRRAFDQLLATFKKVFTSSPTVEKLPDDFTAVEFALLFVNEEYRTRITFGEGKYIDAVISQFQLGYDEVAPLSIEVKDKSAKLHAENNMDEKTTFTFTDGSAYKVYLKNRQGEKLWSYSDTAKVGDGKVDITATVTLMGKPFSVKVNVDASAVSVSAMAGLSSDLVKKYYDVENRTFTFDRYDITVNPVDVINNCNAVRLSNGLETAVEWQILGKFIDKEIIDLTSGNSFALSPFVTDWFGNKVALYQTSPYTIALSGSVATSVALQEGKIFQNMEENGGKLKASFGSGMTKANPFDASHYGETVKIYVAEGESAIKGYRVDVSGIDTSGIMGDLEKAMYNASGSYTLPVYIKDCMGYEKLYVIKINVIPSPIDKVIFAPSDVGEGLEFTTDADKGYFGTFTVNPLIIEKLKDGSLPQVATCFDGDVSFVTTSLKWDISVIDGVTFAGGKTGNLTLIIGNEIGGYRNFDFKFVFTKIAVSKVALADKQGNILTMGNNLAEKEVGAEDKEVVFDFASLNPYAFSYPHYVVYTYLYGDEAEVKVFNQVANWKTDKPFEVSKLWEKEDTYTFQFAKSGLNVKALLHFVQKAVDDDVPFDFDIISGTQNVVCRHPEGDVTFTDGKLNFKAYGAVAPEKAVDYTNPQKYPQKVRVTFLDGTVENLSVDWDLSNLLSSADVYENGFNGYVYANVIVGEENGEKVYGSRRLKIGVYVASGVPQNIYFGFSIDEVRLTEHMKTGTVGKTLFTASGLYSALINGANQGLVDLSVEDRSVLDSVDNPSGAAIILERVADKLFYAQTAPAKELVSLFATGVKEGYFIATKELSFSVLSYDRATDKVVTTNPLDVANYPTYLYFDYEDDSYEDGMFKVSNWDFADSNGNNKVARYFINEINNKGLSLQEVATKGDLAIKARVGSDLIGYISVGVPVNILPSALSEVEFTDIPLISGSVAGGGISRYAMDYSVVDGQYILTVNPYLADARHKSSYPLKINFTLANKYQDLSMDVQWDLSSVTNLDNLYYGAENLEVYAVIDVGIPFAKIVLPVKLVILQKVIDTVYVDGVESKNIYVDPYDVEPYGPVVEGDLVFLDVKVKFKGDDNLYPLTLKYSKEGIVLSYQTTVYKVGMSVEVGNDAGGWQTLEGYGLYGYPRVLLKAEGVKFVCSNCSHESYVYSEGCVNPGCPLSAWGREYYDLYTLTADAFGNVVTTFEEIDFSKPLPDTIRFTFGTPGAGESSVIEARSTSYTLLGIAFEWQRVEGCLTMVVKNLSILDDVSQTITFDTATGYAPLDQNMFYNWDEEHIQDIVYNKITAGEYIQRVNIRSDVVGLMNFASINIYAWTDENEDGVVDDGEITLMDANAELGAGDYIFRLALGEYQGQTHALYGNGILDESFTVYPLDISANVTVRQGAKAVAENYSATYPATLDDELRAELNLSSIDVNLSILFFSDAERTNPVDFTEIGKVSSGDYYYMVVLDNPNYAVDKKGMFTINPFTLNLTVKINGQSGSGITVTQGEEVKIEVVDQQIGVLTNDGIIGYYKYTYFMDDNGDGIYTEGEEVVLDEIEMGLATEVGVKVQVEITNGNFYSENLVVSFMLTKAQEN